jgi:hypothetical protein
LGSIELGNGYLREVCMSQNRSSIEKNSQLPGVADIQSHRDPVLIMGKGRGSLADASWNGWNGTILPPTKARSLPSILSPEPEEQNARQRISHAFEVSTFPYEILLESNLSKLQ